MATAPAAQREDRTLLDDGVADEIQLARAAWERYEYAKLRGHEEYCLRAKQLEGFYLGGGLQRSEDERQALEGEGRPVLEFNEVLPAINAALGYQIHNRLDIAFRPRGTGTDQDTADALTKVVMYLADQNRLHWHETQVFADGLIEQRGYYDVRVSFDDSTTGEIRITTLDPMDVLPDPDAKAYDPNDWADVIVTRWMALDEIEQLYGKDIGTGIKPQSMVQHAIQRAAIQSLWSRWCKDADAAGLTDFYGLQALSCRALIEGGEALVRLRYRRPEDGLAVALQLQVLEPEHLPATLNQELPSGNVIRAGIEFDRLGRRVAYHLYRFHPGDGALAPMSGTGGMDTVRVPVEEIIHLFRPLRPGEIRGEPRLARALVKLNELDQYDDAELVRKKTAAMFAGFITRQAPEDNLMGEGDADAQGVGLAGLEPGTLQVLEPGEGVTFSQPADVGPSYSEFLRMQFRAVAAAMGITYEMLTGDLTQVNYSSIRAGLLEFRRRCEAIQHGVIVHQLCRPVWQAWMTQAVLEGAIDLPGFTRRKREFLTVKWIPQGWQWVDPKKEFDAMQTAIRCGLLSRSEAISAFGYDAEDVDREIAADNARADALGLIFDSDPRRTANTGGEQGAQVP